MLFKNLHVLTIYRFLEVYLHMTFIHLCVFLGELFAEIILTYFSQQLLFVLTS
jgi:hypothetical protein